MPTSAVSYASARTSRGDFSPGADQRGPATRWVGFRAGGQHYAIDIQRVEEVLVTAEIEPVPGASPVVLGVTNLRGRIITVVDLRRCLDLGGQPLTDSNWLIVANLGAETVALRVDGVAEICNVAAAAIRAVPPTAGREPDPLLAGVVNRDGALLTLLDADRLGEALGRT